MAPRETNQTPAPGAGALDPRRFLTGLFEAAIEAALPSHSVARHLPPRPKGRTIIVGAGKAAASSPIKQPAGSLGQRLNHRT